MATALPLGGSLAPIATCQSIGVGIPGPGEQFLWGYEPERHDRGPGSQHFSGAVDLA